ncbi:MAG: hypothetical protein F2911_11310 [Actinobacteria bacterium]|uniref:Unannotated protein n=1 Tax=freshwater metagenome TaxID=449393 RepID=A0A6J7SG16_9ZZZZ|nr:hypothetical protein [Actinomycetota bacterium]
MRTALAAPDVALYSDGVGQLVIAGPRRGRPPMDVNAAVKGTSAVWDATRRVWTIREDHVGAVVANLRARGLSVGQKIIPWSAISNGRMPEPLPECVACAAPYKRHALAPVHCLVCGVALELVVVRVLADIAERGRSACSGCGGLVETIAAYCGSCGKAAERG